MASIIVSGDHNIFTKHHIIIILTDKDLSNKTISSKYTDLLNESIGFDEVDFNKIYLIELDGPSVVFVPCFGEQFYAGQVEKAIYSIHNKHPLFIIESSDMDMIRKAAQFIENYGPRKSGVISRQEYSIDTSDQTALVRVYSQTTSPEVIDFGSVKIII